MFAFGIYRVMYKWNIFKEIKTNIALILFSEGIRFTMYAMKGETINAPTIQYTNQKCRDMNFGPLKDGPIMIALTKDFSSSKEMKFFHNSNDVPKLL